MLRVMFGADEGGLTNWPVGPNVRAPAATEVLPPAARSEAGMVTVYPHVFTPVLVNAKVRTWLVPCESMTVTGDEKLAVGSPTLGRASRLAVTVTLAVGVAGTTPFTGTTMSPTGALRLTAPALVAIQPCTCSPVMVSRVPFAASWKLPARV